ncbi:MAG: membrane protein insertion efficiency factor YidD [Bacteroidales bacterium]|nr:membrane protein insertion efficiency factor YidD [Bacteroidales bacterium]MBR6277359.1 membrane protein insertion efficiency factor YidD [Bacteroidales bacterium]
MKLLPLIRKIFLLPVYFYRAVISPWLPDACRHTPTCSQYCIQAVMKHGIFVGFFLAAFRILRCNPWGTSGIDNVPEKGCVKEYLKKFFRCEKS